MEDIRVLIETAQIVAMISVPAVGGLISYLHKQNTARWTRIEHEIKRGTKDHKKMARRLTIIESVIAARHYKNDVNHS